MILSVWFFKLESCSLLRDLSWVLCNIQMKIWQLIFKQCFVFLFLEISWVSKYLKNIYQKNTLWNRVKICQISIWYSFWYFLCLRIYSSRFYCYWDFHQLKLTNNILAIFNICNMFCFAATTDNMLIAECQQYYWLMLLTFNNQVISYCGKTTYYRKG